MSKKPRVVGAFEPPRYDDYDIRAMQAFFAGKASESQQKIVLRWIIEGAAATYDLSYRPGPDGDRQTAFAEGRRFVGLQMVKLAKSVPRDPTQR